MTTTHVLLVGICVVLELVALLGSSLSLGQDAEATLVEGDFLHGDPRVTVQDPLWVVLPIRHHDPVDTHSHPHRRARVLLVLKSVKQENVLHTRHRKNGDQRMRECCNFFSFSLL